MKMKFVSTQQTAGAPGYPERSGQEVEVLFELHSTLVDHEVGPMYRIKFTDGVEADAFQDELKGCDQNG